MMQPFEPIAGATLNVANAIAATAAAKLHDSAAQVVLYNTSSTAIAYWRCQPLAGSPALATTADFPIPPGQMIRVSVPHGPKQFSIIASAADGAVLVAQGRGN